MSSDTFGLLVTPAFFEGVLLAVNALPDVTLAVEGPGCVETKAMRVAWNHDRGSTLFDADGLHRVAATEHGCRMVLGNLDRVRELSSQMIVRWKPSVHVLMPFAVPQAMGVDLEGVARDLEARHGVPVVRLQNHALAGDWLTGWETALTGLAGQSLPPASDDRRSVAVVGNVFTRAEGDDRGNVREIERLLNLLGLRVGPVWTSGTPFAGIRDCSAAGTLVALPYGHAVADVLAGGARDRVVRTGLPIGLDGTARWLGAIGESLGLGTQARELVDRELARTVAAVKETVALTCHRIRVAVIADRHLAPALVDALQELGIRVPLCTVLTRSPLEEGTLPDGCRVLVDPPLVTLVKAVLEADVDVVIGSGMAQQAAMQANAGLVEIGYPSSGTHFLADAPWYGFTGALHLVQRVVNEWARTRARAEYDGVNPSRVT